MHTSSSNAPLEGSVPAYSVLGQKTLLSISLIRSSALQRGFPLFFVLVVAVLVLLNTHGYTKKFGPGLTTWIWTVSVFGLVAWYMGMVALLIQLKKIFPRLVIIVPIVGIVAMSFNTYLTMLHASFYSSEPVLLTNVISHMPFNIPMGLIFETLFFTYVIPVLERDAALKKRHPKPGRRMISVSGEDILVSSIVLLKAQDHYVEVVTDSGRVIIRTRITDMVAQLTEDDGVMPHRSYWVAWRKIGTIDKASEYRALTMIDGSNVPIAKSRMVEVEAGVAHHQINGVLP